MKKRETIKERLVFPIGTTEDWKQPLLFKDVKNAKGVLLTDSVMAIGYTQKESSGFGMMDEDDICTLYTPSIEVDRERVETDNEYKERMDREISRIRENEDRDRLDYLRLKAKFEQSEQGTS